MIISHYAHAQIFGRSNRRAAPGIALLGLVGGFRRTVRPLEKRDCAIPPRFAVILAGRRAWVVSRSRSSTWPYHVRLNGVTLTMIPAAGRRWTCRGRWVPESPEPDKSTRSCWRGRARVSAGMMADRRLDVAAKRTSGVKFFPGFDDGIVDHSWNETLPLVADSEHSYASTTRP